MSKMVITSLENEKVKHYFKLQQKKYRDLNNEFLVEGEHLVLEAAHHQFLKEVMVSSDKNLNLNVPVYQVTEEILKKISKLDTPPDIIGLCKKNEDQTIGDRILILDSIQDPGNLGTIIRSAVAFDIDTIILGDNTVDLYNPKVLRATQGMIFHIPIFRFEIKELIPMLKALNIPLLSTKVENGINIEELSSGEKKRFALIAGNEGQGVKKEYLDASDKCIYIPTNQNVESLNVAIATSIILYEMRKY